MAKETYVKVPRSELDKLEEARVKIWELVYSLTEDDPLARMITTSQLLKITKVSWKLSNRKWEEVEELDIQSDVMA